MMSDLADMKSSISRSESELSEYASRLDEECARLLVDIRRIGVPGEPHTTFGELFDDDEVSNYYEALVGTLKAAKKQRWSPFRDSSFSRASATR